MTFNRTAALDIENFFATEGFPISFQFSELSDGTASQPNPRTTFVYIWKERKKQMIAVDSYRAEMNLGNALPNANDLHG